MRRCKTINGALSPPDAEDGAALAADDAARIDTSVDPPASGRDKIWEQVAGLEVARKPAPKVTLLDLQYEPYWVGWRQEVRKGSETKVPYIPQTDRGADTGNPHDWDTAANAWQWRETHGSRNGTAVYGVGFVLGTRVPGTSFLVGGIDLDTCRFEPNYITPEAQAVIDRFATYTEVSPSLTGVKLYFLYHEDDLPEIAALFRDAYGKDRTGLGFKQGGGKHPPAIEIYRSNRYFAFTNNLVGTVTELRAVTVADLELLITQWGPQFVAQGEQGQTGKKGQDNSRSARAMREGAALKHQGYSYEEMCAGLLESEDQGVAEWAQEQIDLKDGERGLQRIWDKVEVKSGGKKKDNSRQSRAWKEIVKLKREGCDYDETKARLLESDDQGVVDWVNDYAVKNDEKELKRAWEMIKAGPRGSNKPRIFWSGETDDEACNLAEAALVSMGTLYERMGIIVNVARGRGRTRQGEIICFPVLKERNEYGLRRDLARVVQFTEENKLMGGVEPIHPPMDLIRMLKNEGQTSFPVISALIHTPTLRHDGSILQTPGFDERTGLLFEPQGVDFLPVLERPTKADAEDALNVLLHLIREFPFEGRKGEASPSRSVALAFILLAPVRQSFLFAPGTSMDAPTPRTGKGKLVNLAHMIAFGHRAVVDNWTTNEEENEKMLGAILLKGVGALAIDNIERPVGGGLISKVLTEEKISVRILGKSELPNCEPCLLVSFTGNNSKFKKDITARLLKCRLDAGME
ncbi:MAG: hypothetical protein WA231_17470, partial [Methylocella sp.]